MIRSGNKLLSTVLASVVAASLAACGGGGSHSTSLPQTAPTSGAPAAPYTGPLAAATFKITIPVPSQTSDKARQPAYVSSSTAKVVFTLNSDTVGLTGAALATFNANVLGAKTVTLNSAQCPGTGPWTCTFTIQLPPGTDNVTMSAQDSSNNVLSQQTQTFSVVVATANSFPVTLDAQVFTMSVQTAGSTTQFAGPLGGAIANSSQIAVISPPNTASNAQSFTVSVKDHAGKSIIGPGLPTMAVTTANNTDITVSNVVQESNDGGTPYSFTLTASAATASVASITPTDVTVKFTGANSPTDGISLVSQTFHVSNAKLLVVSGGTPSQINLYAYGDGQLVQFGSTITSAGSLGMHGASEVQFDNAENLYVADFGNANASAVFKIPRANLQNATPAATQITAPAGNPKKLEPYWMNFMDVAGDGTITVAQNSNDFSDPQAGGTVANQPDTILVAAANSSTFTLGWNNIGTFGEGCACESSAQSVAALTDSSHTTPFAYGGAVFPGAAQFGSLGGLVIVYPANVAGTTAVTCDTPSGTTTCYEADSTSNTDAFNNSWTSWDYKNQKLLFFNDDQANSFSKLLDFAATGGVVSTTSTVLDTIDLGTTAGIPYPLAVSRHGRVSAQYSYQGASPGQRVNVYDNSSSTRVLNGMGDTPVIGGGSSMAGTGFVSDATTDALVVIGKDAASGGNNVLRVYSLAGSRLASFTLPFAPLDLGLAAQSHSQRAVRRGDRRSSF